MGLEIVISNELPGYADGVHPNIGLHLEKQGCSNLIPENTLSLKTTWKTLPMSTDALPL